MVTRAARGIGRAIARRLGDHGASVVAVDKDAEALAAAYAHGEASVMEGDLGGNDPGTLADALIREHGGPDLIVNNVGIETPGGFSEIDEYSFDLVFATNLRGPWFFTKRLVDSLIAAGRRGAILFISSLHDTYVYGRPHYSASKAAVAMLTRELAHALGPHGIRVNAISPGAIDTYGEPPPDPRPDIPLGRVGLPDDVARLATVLLSEECAGYVTGANVPVDGGAALCRIRGGARP